mgnify:CR=1 FL=1
MAYGAGRYAALSGVEAMKDNEVQAKRCTNLIVAVIINAISDYERAGFHMKSAYKALESEPARWILSDRKTPFSFIWCCEQVNLAPHRLRSQMGMARITARAKDKIRESKAPSAAMPCATIRRTMNL